MELTLSSRQIAELAGVRPIGLVPKRRTCINFDAPAELSGKLQGLPMAFDCGETFYFKPDAGVRLSGEKGVPSRN